MYDFFFGCEFHHFYAASMRGSFFSGFLTLGGFLFSANTFIVIHMKKEVYEHAQYLRRLKEIRTVNPDHSHYGGLKRLSQLLVVSLSVSLIASIFQLTVGLAPYNLAAMLCILVAIAALILLGVSIYMMATNLQQWFIDLESHSPDLLDAVEGE